MPTIDTPTLVIVLWLLAFGGAVGSFLNVVVYRLPLGLSLIHPPSHCPKCGKAICWFDNVPVFGWIMLRGRCRQCHNLISARYPIVEAVTAALFATVAIVEMPYLCKADLYGLYPYHLLLLCTLLCAGLIEYDGNRPPVKLFVPALVVGLVAPCIWRALWPMPPWDKLPEWLRVPDTLGILILLGIVWFGKRRQMQLALFLVLICVFVYLGWPAVIVIPVIAVVCLLLLWLLERLGLKLNIPPIMLFGVLALIWILVWMSLASY